MKKYTAVLISLMLAACAQDPYRLKIDNNLGSEHGKSIYFRSSMRSSLAGPLRGTLSKKFAESGMRTATSADIADFIGVFDIETFYKQSEDRTYFKTQETEQPLFSSAENGTAMSYSGNGDMKTDHDKTCFTLKIGRKNSSSVMYSSSFCAAGVKETEDMAAAAVSIYGKYGNYRSADAGVQCYEDVSGKFDCDTVHDRQQAFINSLWIDKEISDD